MLNRDVCVRCWNKTEGFSEDECSYYIDIAIPLYWTCTLMPVYRHVWEYDAPPSGCPHTFEHAVAEAQDVK